MPTNTYTALATLTLTSTDSLIDFQNIPATYRDLVLVIDGSVNANSNIIYYYNNDANNGNAVWMTGSGSGSGSSSTINFMFAGTWDANLKANAVVQVMDYSATDKHKTALARGDQPGTGTWALANRWASNTAVNRLTIDPTGTNSFNIGSTFSLYGIAS